MGELWSWLEGVGLGKYAQVLTDNEVDYEILPELTEPDLEKLGIPLGARKKLLKAISALSEGGSVATKPPASRLAAASSSHAPIQASEAERRQLTVMFCDLVDSTAMSVRFDPEDLSRILNSYRTRCEQITQFGGNVARYMGDGVLVYFGYPQAHELDSERAVRAGLEIVSSVSELELWPQLKLQTRIGIATGMVVVGELIGSGLTQEQQVVGETPNLAARLQGIAKPDTVVIADATRRLIGRMFEYGDLGQHNLKGFTEVVQAWQVLGEHLQQNRFEATHHDTELTPIVGRDDETQLLERRWQQAKAGEGQVVLLAGEAGIGKSRLIEYLRAHLSEEPHTLARFYCSPYHQNSALHPVTEHLERTSGFTRRDTPDEKLDKLEALIANAHCAVAEVAPLFSALLSIPDSGRYAPLNLSPERQKEESLQALLAQLSGLARDKPVLVVFEDLHWVDPTTVELLERTIEAVESLPILLLLTFRAEFASHWAGHPHVTALTLNRLNAAKSDEVIAGLTGNRALPAQVRHQILEHADGVPLFVEELTKTVLEAGFLKDEGTHFALDGPLPALGVPSTLHDSLMARLDRFASSKDIVQVAAVIGRQIAYELLAALSPLKGKSLDSALNQLIEAELIHRRGVPPLSTYTFKHALVQEAAYSSLLHAKKQVLHGEVAKVLESQFPDRAQAEPELLAHHFTSAGLTQDAIGYWIKAGQRAVDRGAHKEALAHLATGLGLLNSLAPSTKRDQQELRLQTARAAALQATEGFGAANTGDAYARARQLCAQLSDAPEIFPVLHGVFLFHMLRGEVRLGIEAAQSCLAQAQVQDDITPLLFGHRSVGSGLLHVGQFAAAREHLEQMRDLAQSRIEQSPSVYGIHPRTAAPAFLSLTLFILGYCDRAHQAAEESLRHARELEHLHNLGYALYWSNMTAIQRGEFSVVRERSQRLKSLGEEQGFSQWGAFGTFQHGVALAGTGESDAGIAQMRQGLNEYRGLGSVLYLPFMEARLAITLASAGSSDEAMSTLGDALTRCEQTQETWFEAELHRLKGELMRETRTGSNAEAEACFRKALDIARGQQARSWELRAAASLARMQRNGDGSDEAQLALSKVYDWFTEGFDTPDLQAAKSLLATFA